MRAVRSFCGSPPSTLVVSKTTRLVPASMETRPTGGRHTIRLPVASKSAPRGRPPPRNAAGALCSCGTRSGPSRVACRMLPYRSGRYRDPSSAMATDSVPLMRPLKAFFATSSLSLGANMASVFAGSGAYDSLMATAPCQAGYGSGASVSREMYVEMRNAAKIGRSVTPAMLAQNGHSIYPFCRFRRCDVAANWCTTGDVDRAHRHGQ
mmetsp:Transcript_20727/g.62455  ORF Transcript_20727/g.62455 Transcript_20727/m.62455 type:complete len:208 (+) Transcript_20727:1351-1974(+)